MLKWLYLAGIAILLWRMHRLRHPLVALEVYLLVLLIANAIYSPGASGAWLALQPITFLARVAVLLELWWYATLRMLPRERWSILTMCFWFGLAWVLAAWDVHMGDTIRTVGHIRNRLNIGLAGMLITGMLYLWSRPLPLHRNIHRHAWILLAHLSAQCLADALWVHYPLDRAAWMIAHYAVMTVNLCCLAAWGLALSSWESRGFPRAPEAASR